jgi:hypothetical protein
MMTDLALLDLIQKRGIRFFLDEADPSTGLISDRAPNFDDGSFDVASIACSGFGLPAYAIGAERGWIAEEEAYERSLILLRFALNELPHEHGFFFHWMEKDCGIGTWNFEFSSIDTALFIAGALFAGEYFKGTEVDSLADQLYRRVDWNWMLNGQPFLSMGYLEKEQEFIPHYWDRYCETLLINPLAIGSPTYSVGVETWKNMEREWLTYGDATFINCPPLFTHQYHHCFFDFSRKHDGIADYWENTKTATLANRQYCIDRMDQFKTYGSNSWGLSACDGPEGYNAYGLQPENPVDDGTINLMAAGASMPFTPAASISALRYFYEEHSDRVWGRYGFSDSFNRDRNWVAADTIGIDVGALILGIENYRSGLIGETSMRNPHIRSAFSSIFG